MSFNEQTLTSQEKDILYDIVIDFENNSGKYNYDQALQAIASIMKRFLKPASIINGKRIVRNPATMPFLISQVLFFIAVSCIQRKISAKAVDNQKYILDKLNSYLGNTPVSHNFFSRMHNTPTQYAKMIKYKQPKFPLKYAGQKTEDLAIAIKNLVYQSGKYDIFCDIFGGSGAASLAVDKRKDSKYVYNELNSNMYNLFCVLVDDVKHKELINELELLQKDLRGDGIWLDFDETTEIQKFFTSRRGSRTQNETNIKGDGWKDLELDYNAIVAYMQDCRDIVDLKASNFTFTFEGTTYSKKNLLDKIFPDEKSNSEYRAGYESYMSFINNFRLIEACCANLYSLSGEYSKGNTSQRESVAASQDRFKQFRFYKYYAYFSNLLKSSGVLTSDSMVRYAVAEIYLHSLVTSGSADVSAILRMLYGAYGRGTKSNKPDKFLENDFRDIITKIHKLGKNTICENLDCLAVIDKYKHDGQATDIKHNTPLFYSDSPYAETKDYADKDAGVSNFSPADMKNLILALSNSGDKFIFSCRAIKGSLNGSKTSDILRGANQNIFGNVFEYFVSEFFEKKKGLWVLAIEKPGETLADLVKKNEIAEIMITNFEIVDFKGEKDSKPVFKVYTFEEFLQILIKKANV